MTVEPATGVDPVRPIGFGNLARKEDARFIRGRGNYVDDIHLPEMLYGAVLRSPYAHARIVSIDTTAAVQHPKVHAVLTGADLIERDLAWMHDLGRHAGGAGDRQGPVPGPRGRIRRRR